MVEIFSVWGPPVGTWPMPLPDQITKAPQDLNWGKATDVVTFLGNIVVGQ